MSRLSRRAFIGRSAAGIAAVGAATSAPVLASLAGAAGSQAPAGEAELAAEVSPAEPLVARVLDVSTGEIEFFLGERQVTSTDPGLAARLLRAVR